MQKREPCWLFPEIDWFEDAPSESGPIQMAMDEVLLGMVERPLLRNYRWCGSWVSFGYAQKWDEIQQAFPGRNLVRRWSGGGAVDHAEDWTFSLIIPATDPMRRLPTTKSYQGIHRCLRAALSWSFQGVREVSKEEECIGTQCFLSPRQHDLWCNGVKVAGGAQRRTLAGLLHQGSIQHLRLPTAFAQTLAAHFAKKTNLFISTKFLRDKAIKLATVRYETEEWLKRH